MDKMVAVNQKRRSKQPKNKKQQQQQQPLKVVYITNPIKFNTTASEFRALVQELTGQDSTVAEHASFTAAEGVGGKEEVVEKAAAHKGSDLSTSGSCSPEMIDNFEGFAASSLWHGDVFKGLG